MSIQRSGGWLQRANKDYEGSPEPVGKHIYLAIFVYRVRRFLVLLQQFRRRTMTDSAPLCTRRPTSPHHSDTKIMI